MPKRIADREDAPQIPENPLDELLTIHEVANRLRVDDTTVRRWIGNGVLDAVTLPHLGKRKGYRVKKSTFDHLLENESSAGE